MRGQPWGYRTNSGNRFWIENAPGYLAPGSGTFFYSAQNRTVYYAPTMAEQGPGPGPGGTTTITAEVVAPRLVELVTSDQPGVRFANVGFEHSAVDFTTCFDPTSPNHCGGMGQSAFLNSSALRFDNGSAAVELVNVTVAHTGGYAVWFAPGARDSAIRQSQLVDLGGGGVSAFVACIESAPHRGGK